MQTKRVYVDNQTENCATCGAQLREQLTKWGQFQVVDDAKDAELLFVLKSTSERKSAPIVGATATGATYEGMVDYQENTVFLSVIEPPTSRELYSGKARKCWRWSKPTGRLVSDLRKRIEERQKATK